ncbi:MAG: PF20097 family protein [Fusicatenibacter sp.]
MKCPYCNVEMIHGYLNCGTTIWSEKKHRISCLPNSKEQFALHLRAPYLTPHHIESDCCPKCKRIIINAADYETNIGE